MIPKYLKYSAEHLLDEFGGGGHKPGSGSAAAFQGLISAQLVKTVLQLSLQKKSCAEHHPEFDKHLNEIESDILPRLQVLFQSDSEKFHEVFELRTSKKSAKSITEKGRINLAHSAAMKAAIEIPLEIGADCTRIAEIAAFAFDHGFHAVRGDSAVSLNGAIAGFKGCIAIIDLNSLSLISSDWSEDLIVEIKNLRKNLGRLDKLSTEKFLVLQDEAKAAETFWGEVVEIFNRATTNPNSVLRNAEDIARSFQNALWKKIGRPAKELELLVDPELALKELGYQFQSVFKIEDASELGTSFEPAGIIDKKNRTVVISEKFPIETQRFTAAHELAHALLHDHNIMHRDRPVDGSENRIVKDKQEFEADKFAACFLMPRSLVVREFKKIFGSDSFELNEDSAYALAQRGVEEMKEMMPTPHDLCLKLSSTKLYKGYVGLSLSEIFCVSIKTMAIRLQELNIVKP